MGHIYRQAEKVLVWLGGKSADSDIAFDAMNRLLQPKTVPPREHNDHEGCVNSDVARTWDNDEYLAFGRLLKRQWFCRAWIVQEIAFAKEAVLLCGNREIHWDDFTDSIEMASSKLDSITESLQSSPVLGINVEILENFKISPPIALLGLLKRLFLKSSDGTILRRQCTLQSLVTGLAGFQATDARDKIYALLSLADDGIPPNALPLTPSDSQAVFQPLTADYTKSTLDVYSNFISHCITTSGSLDMISRPWAPLRRTKWHKRFKDPELRFRVPSWISVLDDLPFGDPKKGAGKRIKADTLVGEATSRVYNACNGMRARCRFGMNEADNTSDGCLFAKGVEIGTVTELSTRMADGIVSRDCLDMIGGIERNPDGQPTKVTDTVWRTLCGNRDELGRRASSIRRYALLHLLQRLRPSSTIDTVELLENDPEEYIGAFLQRVQAVIWNRKVASISSPRGGEVKLIGLVPTHCRVGDVVCVLLGGSVPFVLRRHTENAEEYWELIGENYIEGQMDGEALSCFTEQGLNLHIREFAIC